MTKATEGPRRTRQLVNHRHAHSAVMTGTVALCHAMLRHGKQGSDDHDDDHAWTYDDAKTRQMDCWPSLLVSPSLGLSTTRVGRTHLSTCNLFPGLYI